MLLRVSPKMEPATWSGGWRRAATAAVGRSGPRPAAVERFAWSIAAWRLASSSALRLYGFCAVAMAIKFAALNVLPPNEGLIGVKVMSPAAAGASERAHEPTCAALNAVRIQPDYGRLAVEPVMTSCPLMRHFALLNFMAVRAHVRRLRTLATRIVQ